MVLSSGLALYGALLEIFPPPFPCSIRNTGFGFLFSNGLGSSLPWPTSGAERKGSKLGIPSPAQVPRAARSHWMGLLLNCWKSQGRRIYHAYKYAIESSTTAWLASSSLIDSSTGSILLSWRFHIRTCRWTPSAKRPLCDWPGAGMRLGEPLPTPCRLTCLMFDVSRCRLRRPKASVHLSGFTMSSSTYERPRLTLFLWGPVYLLQQPPCWRSIPGGQR